MNTIQSFYVFSVSRFSSNLFRKINPLPNVKTLSFDVDLEQMEFFTLSRKIPTLDGRTMSLTAYADASLGNLEHSKTQGGRVIGLEDESGKAAGIICHSGSLKRVWHTARLMRKR